MASAAGVGVMSVARYESGETVRQETIDKLQAAFKAHGVEITNGTGTGAKLLNKPPKPNPKRKKTS
ncbi:MAG: hypothetical protein K2X34_06095 [Hyphomonadaceae bacterium]|nr:hypothetical protein [Hyphomonadaceae bacterium]